MTNRNVTDSSQEGGNHHPPPGPPDHLLSHGGNKESGNHHPPLGPPDHLLSRGGNKGEGGDHYTPSGPPDHLLSRSNNKVFKSGPLFLSSKGIGWTSWKKRWFILTRTSLVFFRSDPNAVTQKGNEVNLTLGGIDLNNSGRVDVKADKKLLTVLFPDGRDGRAFTLKAETSEDLHEWKIALEEALAQAPSATLVMGQNGIFRNDQADAVDGPVDQLKEKQPVKSLVIGRPILLALEDIDGNPSFLEKALRFVEEHGVKVEGILRQAADVDDVEHRIREYEQGKMDFSPEEDAHVIADCVKYVLRELPSSPVPASCCKALLEACRTEHSRRLAAMREAICETFPEPNRKLLQRILMMMQAIASHKAENRMSCPAVAACMAPLLLRPLLAGDCDLEHDFDVGSDGSIQLLQAAAAANHAQAIVVTLLEEYENIFGEGSMSTELYSDSEESGSESEELSDYDDETTEDGTCGAHADIDEELEEASNETHSETGSSRYDDKGSYTPSFGSDSNESDYDHQATLIQSREHDDVQSSGNITNQTNSGASMKSDESAEVLGDDPAETSLVPKLTDKNSTLSNGPVHGARRAAVWGRTPAKKKLSMDSIDFPFEDEAEVERLEVTKIDLQNRVAEEAKENAVLQESLEKQKNALHERRLGLEQEVARLRGQLNKERELRKALEAGLELPQGSLLLSASIDEKTKAELEEIVQLGTDVINLKQTADDLGMQLNQQRELNSGFVHSSGGQARLRERGIEIEATATLHTAEKLTRSKDNQLDKVDGEKDLKHELPSVYLNKQLPQKHMMDPARNSKSVGLTATSSSANSKKSGPRDEGATNSTSSALSKLTNRLNFLKERRGQIANELQNMDKGRSSGSSVQSFERSSGLERRHSVENPDKFYGTIDNQSVYNSQKGLEIRSSHSPVTYENTERVRMIDGGSLLYQNKGKMEAQIAPNLERGKSESFPKVDKGRRSEGHPHVPPRTYSR